MQQSVNVAQCPRPAKAQRQCRVVPSGLDLGAALQATGVALVTEEPDSDELESAPRVYVLTSVSLVYAVVGDTLVAYATDLSSGAPVGDVVVALDAISEEVRLCPPSVAPPLPRTHLLTSNCAIRAGSRGICARRAHLHSSRYESDSCMKSTASWALPARVDTSAQKSTGTGHHCSTRVQSWQSAQFQTRV